MDMLIIMVNFTEIGITTVNKCVLNVVKDIILIIITTVNNYPKTALKQTKTVYVLAASMDTNWTAMTNVSKLYKEEMMIIVKYTNILIQEVNIMIAGLMDVERFVYVVMMVTI